MAENLVILSPHFPPHYHRFWIQAKRAGGRTLGIGDTPEEALAPEVREALTDYRAVGDLHDYDALLRTCGGYIQRFGRIERLESLNEYWLDTEARLRDDFNIPGPRTAEIGRVRRKSRMKEVFRAAGLPTAPGRLAHSLEEALAFAAEAGFPLIAKPDAGVGARDTHRLESEAQLAALFAARPAEPWFLEAFVSGALHSFDGLADRQGRPLFTTAHVFSQGILETVREGRDLFYYSLRDIPPGLEDAGLRARYDLSGWANRDLFRGLLAHLSAAYHTDRQGLPGGVPIEDIDSSSRRRKSSSPRDVAQTDEARLRTGIEADLGRAGALRLFGGLRDRAGDYVLGYTPLKPKSSQTSTLDETTLTLEAGWVLDWGTGPLAHTLQLGAEAASTEYVTERLDQRERKNSDLAHGALFALHRTRWGDRVSLDLGGRAHLFRGTFRNDDLVSFGGTERWVNGEKFHKRFRDLAGQAGLVWTPRQETSLFAAVATSFRIPNVDEFALAEDDLKPQHGRHVDLGWRERWGRRAETGIALFWVDIEDEIAFDPNLRLNRNYEETTRRLGAELSARLFLTDRLTLRGNAAYTRARFLDPGRDVPLVPRHSANLGLEWRPVEALTISVLGAFVGDREDGSSLGSRRFAEIDGYRTVDLKLAYTWRGLKVFGGVNNLFDERYATAAFSETYYPMPTRNFYGGLQWSF